MLFVERNYLFKDGNDHRPEDQPKKQARKSSIEHIGLDVGTASIICCWEKEGQLEMHMEPNAFFKIPFNPRTAAILSQKEMHHFQKDGDIYILGSLAEKSANIFKQDTKRPMKKGLLNPSEPDAILVIGAILDRMIPMNDRSNTQVVFSVPGDPMDREGAVVYHESLLRMQLKNIGLESSPINEALAVILAEISSGDATALGISVGGGMCNICLSYLSMPVLSFSIQKGGDTIDYLVGSAIGESATYIKHIKEQSLDLSKPPKDRIETALHIYYDDLFKSLAQSLQTVLGSSDQICRLPDEIPVIISGGSMLPAGSLERFRDALRRVHLPLRISDVVLPANPLAATAIGALKMAMVP